MVKKFLSVFTVVAMLFPTVALADETPAPENTVVQVKAGDVVPYDGILLSLDAAAKVLNEKRFYLTLWGV